MMINQVIRKAASAASGGALLLALAGGAFAQSGLAGSGTLSGATITSKTVGSDTCFTLTLAPDSTGNFLVDNGTSYRFTAVNGFFLSPSGATPDTTTATGFTAKPLTQPDASGFSGDKSGKGYGKPDYFLQASGAPAPGGGTNVGNSAQFCFLTGSLPASYSVILDVFAPGNLPNGSPTGRIKITGPTPPAGVPEPGTYAAFLVGGLGVLALMAGARRRGASPAAA